MKVLVIPGLAIIGIVTIECVALMNNINGLVLASSLALVSGIGGFTARDVRDHIKRGINKDDGIK